MQLCKSSWSTSGSELSFSPSYVRHDLWRNLDFLTFLGAFVLGGLGSSLLSTKDFYSPIDSKFRISFFAFSYFLIIMWYYLAMDIFCFSLHCTTWCPWLNFFFTVTLMSELSPSFPTIWRLSSCLLRSQTCMLQLDPSMCPVFLTLLSSSPSSSANSCIWALQTTAQWYPWCRALTPPPCPPSQLRSSPPAPPSLQSRTWQAGLPQCQAHLRTV